MQFLVGPILSRDGGYAFDTFARAEGLKPGFRYSRVEEASYDRRATLRALTDRKRVCVAACDTLAEFDRRCAMLALEADGALPAPHNPPAEASGANPTP